MFEALVYTDQQQKIYGKYRCQPWAMSSPGDVFTAASQTARDRVWESQIM
jgi:hypothetical protein